MTHILLLIGTSFAPLTHKHQQNVSAVRCLIVLVLEKCKASSYTFALYQFQLDRSLQIWVELKFELFHFQLDWSLQILVTHSHFSIFNLTGHCKFEIFDVRCSPTFWRKKVDVDGPLDCIFTHANRLPVWNGTANEKETALRTRAFLYTQRNLFEILLNQSEIRLYLPFSDWFEQNGRPFRSK